MSVNPNVYGASTQWLPVGGAERWTVGQSKDWLKVAYFTASTWNSQTLGAATDAGALEFGEPIDKSLSYCGLGTESAFSHLKYIDKKEVLTKTAGSAIDPYYTDNRSITNFAFMFGNTPSSMGQYGGYFYFKNDGEINYRMWAPVTDTELSILSTQRGLVPVTYFSFKNFILLIRVKACTGFDTSDEGQPLNTGDYDLYTYCNSIAHESKPYVYSVYFVPYSYVANSEQREASTTGQLGLGVEVLDGLGGGLSAPISQYAYNYAYNQNNAYNFKVHGMYTGGYNYQQLQYNNFVTDDMQSGYIACCPDTWTLEVTYKDADYNCVQAYRVFNDSFEEECIRAVACFGCFFTPKIDTALTGELNDTDMYCGTLEEGIGHGNYTKGTDNEEQPQYTTDGNETGYDPSNPPAVDPNSYTGSMRTAIVSLSTATDRYCVDTTSMIFGLMPQLWDIMALADPDKSLTDYSLDTFLVNNPIDCIVSLQYLPVKDMGGAATTIHLGKYDTHLSVTTAKTSILYDCGDYEVYPREGDNWISRQMQITLYLPFCGTVSIDPETYIGRTINVEYAIDLTTGTCTAFVSFIDAKGKRVITDTASGVCAIDLPVTGLQQQTLNSQLFNASENVKQLKVNNAFRGFSSIMGAVQSLDGNMTGAISGILGATQDVYNIFQSEKVADYNLQHTMLPMKMIGASGGLTGAMCELYPTIIFSRPTVDYNKKAYAHSIGFATCESGLLSGYSGYTEVTNVDLSGFDATAAEKEMIKSLLASGVYL